MEAVGLSREGIERHKSTIAAAVNAYIIKIERSTRVLLQPVESINNILRFVFSHPVGDIFTKFSAISQAVTIIHLNYNVPIHVEVLIKHIFTPVVVRPAFVYVLKRPCTMHKDDNRVGLGIVIIFGIEN